jgi:hypothetical protein
MTAENANGGTVLFMHVGSPRFWVRQAQGSVPILGTIVFGLDRAISSPSHFVVGMPSKVEFLWPHGTGETHS